MKTYTEAEAIEYIAHNMDYDLSETDKQGQIILYTNLYRWNDNTIRNIPDPDYDRWS